MLQLNYHHLYYFKVIATEGSISKAAEQLRLGQPTVSMQLKQFEDFLGFPLFERKNRQLVLTEMGRVILTYANEIFRLGDEMMDTIKDRPVQRRMRMQMGALDSVPKSVIRDLMAKAYQKSECQISVLEGNGEELIRELIEHRLDLLLLNSPPPARADKKLFSRSLIKMPLIVAGAEKYFSLKGGFPHSINRAPFILPTSHSRVRQDVERYFQENQIIIDMIAETQDASLMKTLAIEGRGLMVVSESAIKDSLDNKTLFKIGELPGLIEEIWLIAAQRKMQNPMAQELMKDYLPQL